MTELDETTYTDIDAFLCLFVFCFSLCVNSFMQTGHAKRKSHFVSKKVTGLSIFYSAMRNMPQNVYSFFSLIFVFFVFSVF